MLSIYVDDFKLAGPRENLVKGWTLLKEVLTWTNRGQPDFTWDANKHVKK